MSSVIRRSLAFSAVERYASVVIAFVTTVVLARLLTPQDFGVFSIAMSFVILADIFRDFGMGNYLVQVRQLTDQQLRSAFTGVLSTSALCALLLLLGMPILAAFYGDERFWQLMPLFALNLMLGPFSVPGTSLLRRRLAFDTLAGINFLATIVNFAVVVVLASLGVGVMSLAWATLATSVVRVTAVWIVEPCLTAFRISVRGWNDPFEFGIVSTATAVLNVIGEYLPQLIVGRTIGLAAVGILGRATSVCQLPDRLVVNALSPVLLPALSQQTHAGVQLRPSYLLALCHMSALQLPMLLCLALLAEPVVLILYGDQWREVAPLVRIMALAALAMFPAFMTYPTLVAIGRVRDTLWMSLISLPPTMLLVLMASRFGLEAVAATQLISAPLQVFVAVSFIRRRIGVSWSDIGGAVWRSGVVALCTAVAPTLVVVVHGGFGFDVSHQALAFALVGAAVGWLMGLAFSKHPLLDELRNVAKLVSQRIRGWAW